MTTWQFDTEFGLEEFLWASLAPLLNLTPIARQHTTEGQICDILAMTSERQLVILELKNVEDRYVVPQLTRYYASLSKEQPFTDQVDYSQPIRLLAIAPAFHAHNFVDREFNRLDIEFLTFEIDGDESTKRFHLKDLDSESVYMAEIPSLFQGSLKPEILLEEPTVPVRVIGRPPKSFRNLLEDLTHEQQKYLHQLRRKILEFDERMTEVGLTTRTQYGLKKGTKGIPNNRVCAELLPLHGMRWPCLHLMLPYPKGGLKRFKMLADQDYSKGLAMAGVPLLHQDNWESATVGFFLGKSRQSPSFGYTFQIDLYARICGKFLGHVPILAKPEDLVDLALQEWKANLDA